MLRDSSSNVLADFIVGNEVPGSSGFRFARATNSAATYAVDVQQIGWVTPAGGNGVLQLKAVTLAVPGAFGPGTGVLEFFSEGYEVYESLSICD